jgi:serine/threonine protein kinase
MARMTDQFERKGTTHSTVGPIRWMSPENIASQTYSEKSDVWSWANTVAEVLTGQEPFPHMQLLEVATLVKTEGMYPGVPDNAPDWLAELLLRCWSFDPAARPTMSQIVDIFDYHVEAI